MRSWNASSSWERLRVLRSVRCRWLVSALVAGLVWAVPASAAPLTVQVIANQSNADPGEFGANIAASALISVLVTNPRTGLPVSNLGGSVGNGTAAISLPPGWSLIDGFNVAPGGCLMTPTEFSNLGGGVYDIRVVPFVTNPACKWLAGDYLFVVALTGANNGRALGVLHIAAR
jgi:hypothetical protein